MSRGKLTLIGVIVVVVALVAFTMFDPNRFVLGTLRGDSWFGGKPSSYWRRLLREEDAPALKAPEAVPVLREALRDKNPGVRARAAFTLGALGPQASAAVPDLIEALNDDSGSPDKDAVRFLKLLLRVKADGTKIQSAQFGSDHEAAYYAVADALVDIDPEAARKVLAP